MVHFGAKKKNVGIYHNIDIPNLVHFGHPPIETNNLGNLLGCIIANRIEDPNMIWRRTYRDDRIAHTHDVETISEKIANSNHIRNSKI